MQHRSIVMHNGAKVLDERFENPFDALAEAARQARSASSMGGCIRLQIEGPQMNGTITVDAARSAPPPKKTAAPAFARR